MTEPRSSSRPAGRPWRVAWALVALLAPILILPACQSPDEYEIDDATRPTALSAAPTATPTNVAPEATPTANIPPPESSPTTAPTPTETPAPTATSAPTAIAAATATEEAAGAPTSAPAPSATPSAADVWSVRQFETEERVMVLTFDAGADVGYTAEILDLLAAEGIHASFGMTGPWAEENPELLQRIVDEGHHLINHSWSHPHFPELTSAERVAEILSLETLVRDRTGVELAPYFRPPFGEYDDATLTDLAAHGYTINVMWTIDSLGWNGLTAEEINERVLDGAGPGAIVLMHVGSQSQDAAALPEMIRRLREQGYSFATVAELADQ